MKSSNLEARGQILHDNEGLSLMLDDVESFDPRGEGSDLGWATGQEAYHLDLPRPRRPRQL